MTSKENVGMKDGENTKHRFWMRSVKLLIAVLITIPFDVCWYQYYADRKKMIAT